MYRIDRLKKKIINGFYDHPFEKEVLDISKVVIITALSALLFTFGFNTFTNPNFVALSTAGVNVSEVSIHQLASCGASGVAQSLLIILKLFKVEWIANESYSNVIFWILYFLVNVPLLLLAWFKIGKRFAFFTALNVSFSLLFGILLKNNDPEFFINKLSLLFINSPLSRVIFAGVFTGLSSGLAYSIETSTGGADVLSYYIGEKKRVLVGKYSMIINTIVVSVFTLFSIIPLDPMYNQLQVSLISATAVLLYTIGYMVVVSFTVDKINVQNKKVQVQIITSEKTLSNSIITALPHSCTIMNGYGGYSLQSKYVLFMSVRQKEVNKLVQICKNKDPHAFVTVYALENVYGKFFRKPIK